MVPRQTAPTSHVARSGVQWSTARRGAIAVGALTLWLAAALPPAVAKTPGAVHCYGKACHRVSTLEEMDGMVGRFGVLKASYYDGCRADRFNACGLTSSGEVFRPDLADNAASPIFPDGTVLVAFNPATRKAAVLRVNSAGPYWGDRKLDVSRAAADKLGFRHRGVAELMVAVVKSPDPHEARYMRERRYEPVPGYLGTFASFDAAHGAALHRLSLVTGAGGVRLAAIEPEPEPPVYEKRVYRDPFFDHAIIYLQPVAPEPATEAGPQSDALSAVNDSTAAAPAMGPETAVPLEDDLDISNHGTADARTAANETALPEVVTAREASPALFEVSFAYVLPRVSSFIAQARVAARRNAWAPKLPPLADLPGRLNEFAERARSKARAGVTRSGPLYKLVAELKLKAQARRLPD